MANGHSLKNRVHVRNNNKETKTKNKCAMHKQHLKTKIFAAMYMCSHKINLSVLFPDHFFHNSNTCQEVPGSVAGSAEDRSDMDGVLQL